MDRRRPLLPKEAKSLDCCFSEAVDQHGGRGERGKRMRPLVVSKETCSHWGGHLPGLRKFLGFLCSGSLRPRCINVKHTPASSHPPDGLLGGPEPPPQALPTHTSWAAPLGVLDTHSQARPGPDTSQPHLSLVVSLRLSDLGAAASQALSLASGTQPGA